MEGKSCSTGDNGGCGKCCPVRGFILPALALAVIIFAFEWMFHGVLMMDLYSQTASMWRPEAEMKSFFPVCLTRVAVQALLITCLYKMVCKSSDCGGSCPKKGAKFGVKIGALLGITHFGYYAYLPIPAAMAIYWLVGYIILGAILGLALSCMASKLVK